MTHSYWRGEFIVFKRSDETADVYSWDAATGSYRWHSDWNSPEEAHRYIEEVEALPEFPIIRPITTHPVQTWSHAPRLPASLHGTTRHITTRRNALK